jgi:pyruvate dehydrogenase E1 component beta subunit
MIFEDRSIHTRTGELASGNPGGKAQITRLGARLTIVAAGRAAALAEDAAEELAKRGYAGAVETVSLGFIKPLDRETVLRSVIKTGRVLIVQDEPECGGYAPVVRCLLDELPAGKLLTRPIILAGADQFLPFWDEWPFLPSLEAVVAAAQATMNAEGGK